MLLEENGEDAIKGQMMEVKEVGRRRTQLLDENMANQIGVGA